MEQKLMQEHLANGCLNAPIEIKQFEIVLRKYQNDDFLDKVNSLEQGQQNNITLAMDGLIQPEDLYITNYITLTSNGQEYLLNLMDYSEFSHTEDFLAKEIEQTLILNGIRRFSGIVTDGAGNVKVAREIVNKKYPNILNLRCITHFINLITKDIIEKFLWGYNVLHNCLKMVLCMGLLEFCENGLKWIVSENPTVITNRDKNYYNCSNGVESCSEFLCQLRKYKLNESPYDSPYTRLDNPINWWSTCEDDYNNWQSNYFLIEEIVNLNGPIFDTSEITVINKSISERRIETINYVAEDIAEEFLVGLEDI
nr:240_t:CDS:2 [Entrophospora candida]